MYENIINNIFGGINCNAAPELISDGEAQDILNLHQEKQGKLVTREGSLIGMTFGVLPITVDTTGFEAIGEFILEEHWSDHDTDRFMVYRASNAGTDGNPSSGILLLAPVTGQYKDTLRLYFTNFEAKAQGSVDPIDQTPMNPTTDFMRFTDRGVDMNEFGYKLIISDRINGDLYLSDTFGDRDPYDCEPDGHALRLRANTLETFDINTVLIDYELGTGEKNDASVGVENGMALYGYKLPRKRGTMTDDHFQELLTRPGYVSGNPGQGGVVDQAFINGSSNAMILRAVYAYNEGGTADGTHTYQKPGASEARAFFQDVHINYNQQYTFTNFDAPGEFDDVFGTLEFHEDDVEDEGKGVIQERAADVYIWQDFRLRYYPCSGTEIGSGNLLRDLDRTWDKMYPGIPRIEDLSEKTGNGRLVPLGSWSYRFVWDFGNNVYSAPSVEMRAGDILWSAVRDTAFEDSYDSDYLRPSAFRQSDILTSTRPVAITDFYYTFQPEGNYPLQYSHPYFFDENGEITTLGGLLKALKEKVYGTSHRFGAQSEATATGAGNLSVLITGFFSAGNLPLKGFMGEDAIVNSGVRTYAPKLIIPIFKAAGVVETYNSVFTDDGKYRLAYHDRQLTGLPPRQEPNDAYYEIVQPGENADVIPQSVINALEPAGSYQKYDGIGNDYYLSIVCDRDTVNDWDRNNKSDSNLDLKRAYTPFRGIKTQSDSLLATLEDVPPQAVERLVLTGTAELELIRGLRDDYYFTSKTRWIRPFLPLDQTLEHDALRQKNVIGAVAATDNPNFRAQNIGQLGSDWGLSYGELNNLTAIIYGEAHRFIGMEQLTSYFPSGLLFGAPRLRLHIPEADVPLRARKLLIFRTRNSNDNQYQAQEYGLVETVELEWETIAGERHLKNGEVSFFDDVRDSELNFGTSIAEFEGLRQAIASRYNIPISERMVYLNYSETYQPPSPRTIVTGSE